jgi:hypothetical protein
MDAPITADEYRARIESLCARGGRHIFPRRERDRWILLHALSRRFRADEALSEPDVNARIGSWLLDDGASLECDAAALRRALIDDGFLERRPEGSAYKLSDKHQVRVTFAPEVLAIDPAAVIEDARSRAAERKARFKP